MMHWAVFVWCREAILHGHGSTVAVSCTHDTAPVLPCPRYFASRHHTGTSQSTKHLQTLGKGGKLLLTFGHQHKVKVPHLVPLFAKGRFIGPAHFPLEEFNPNLRGWGLAAK
jgi:hypothetical protein